MVAAVAAVAAGQKKSVLYARKAAMSAAPEPAVTAVS